MWKFSTGMTLITILLATVQTEYTIIPSYEVESYHYPAPPKSQQLQNPTSKSRQLEYAAPQVYHNQYLGNYYTSQLLQKSSLITRQFSSPTLDNAAFNLALRNQGYKFGNIPAYNAALTASPRSSKTTGQSAASLPSSSVSSTSSFSPAIGSLNVKLPLPIGITPINIAPLPLQSGASYAALPRGVTSYGTIYPQRKRR